MRPDEPRSFDDDRAVDVTDAEAVRRIAEQHHVAPERVLEAVEIVGSNRTAVDLFLSAPP